MTVCLLCGSRKPAPGIDSPSASREMLKEVERGFRAAKVPSKFVDLRDYELPFWDGRDWCDYEKPDLVNLREELMSSTGFVISAPAHWNSVSGVVKNMIDLVGSEPFKGKMVGLLVVGMDESSAWHGVTQLREILSGLGAWVSPYPIVVGNPRHVNDVGMLLKDLRQFGAYHALLIKGQIDPFIKLNNRK